MTTTSALRSRPVPRRLVKTLRHPRRAGVVLSAAARHWCCCVKCLRCGGAHVQSDSIHHEQGIEIPGAGALQRAHQSVVPKLCPPAIRRVVLRLVPTHVWPLDAPALRPTQFSAGQPGARETEAALPDRRISGREQGTEILRPVERRWLSGSVQLQCIGQAAAHTHLTNCQPRRRHDRYTASGSNS